MPGDVTQQRSMRMNWPSLKSLISKLPLMTVRTRSGNSTPTSDSRAGSAALRKAISRAASWPGPAMGGDEAEAALDEEGLVAREAVLEPLLRLEEADELGARRLVAGEGAIDVADAAAVLGPADAEVVIFRRRRGRRGGRGGGRRRGRRRGGGLGPPGGGGGGG